MTNSDPQYSEGQFRGMVLAKLDNIECSLKTKVDRDEFLPVKALVYGFAGLLFIAVVGALVAQVVKALSL